MWGLGFRVSGLSFGFRVEGLGFLRKKKTRSSKAFSVNPDAQKTWCRFLVLGNSSHHVGVRA